MSFPLPQRRTAWAAFFGLMACFGAHAAGLGAVQVQSALGEPLRISVALLGGDTASYETHCVHAILTSLDGAPLFSPIVRLNAAGNATRTIQLTTREALNEPAFNIYVETSCGTALHREYQILLDPTPTQIAQPLILTASTALHTLPADGKHNARAPQDTESRSKRHTKRHANKQKTSEGLSALLAEAPRNILKISGGESEKPVITRLEVMDDISKPEKRATPDSASPDTDKVAEAMALVKAMHDETQAMRAETERLKQQYARDRNEMEGIHKDSLLWIRILSAVVAFCAIAIVWLLLRMHSMKKSSPQVTWNEFFSDTTSTTTPIGPNTEFSPTTFQITTIETEEPIASALESVSGFKNEKSPAGLENDSTEEASFRYVSGGGIPYIYSDQADNAPPQIEVKEDEIAGVMELAEAWMATHDAASVASLLEPFARAEKPQSPLPLICLLDVYRALGDRVKHDAIRKRLKMMFNVRPSDWDLPLDSQPTRVLADYPHVRQRILDLWESDELVSYLDGLVMDKRNGLREGFDLPAYRDILRLKTVATSSGRNGHTMPSQAYAILFPPQRQNIEKTTRATTPESLKPHASSLIFGMPVSEIMLDEPLLEIVTRQEPLPQTASEKPKNFSMREEMSPMAIKLHLAEAYRDIGDKEGARLLLGEVIQEGTPEQVAQAQQLLQGLT